MAPTHPIISVIMPTLNACATLRSALESAQSQSLQEIEILCVDNGSTDDTLQLLKSASSKDQRIKVLNEQAAGSGPARNTGLREARGTFVAFLDSDDRFASNYTLQLLLQSARINNVQIAGGSLCTQLPTGEVIGMFDGLNAPFKFEKTGLQSYSDYQFDYGFYRFIYNREMLVASGTLFPPYLRFQDPPFFVRAMLNAKSFASIEYPSYIHSLRSTPVNWNSEATEGLLNGLRDNLLISKKEKLEKLHRITVERLTTEYSGVIAVQRNSGIKSLQCAESRCLCSIDITMLTTREKKLLLEYYRQREHQTFEQGD